MENEFNEDYIQAFLDAYQGEHPIMRVRHFLDRYAEGTDQKVLYKEFSDCYTDLMDSVTMFKAGIDFMRSCF